MPFTGSPFGGLGKKATSRASEKVVFAEHDSNEQVRLLNQLATADSSLIQVKEDSVMQRVPEWITLEKAGIIFPESALLLRRLHPLSLEERFELIADPENNLIQALLLTLNFKGDLHPAQYGLTMLYEIVREDPSRYDCVCELIQKMGVFELFNQFLERPNLDPYTADKATFILSGIICRSPTDAFDMNDVQYFVRCLILGKASNKYAVSDAGRLDALVNLLKIGKVTIVILRMDDNPFINKNLEVTLHARLVYKALFCVWLLSFHQDFISQLNSKGIIKSTCNALKVLRVEKIVRMCLNIFNNILQNDDAVETVIEENVMQVLTLLEFEKWRDVGVYTEVRECIFRLDQKIKLFSNFDRYCLELDKEKLNWSVLHSEKFWHENVMSFESNEYITIQKLAKLLQSSDPTTLAVACYDLGEFARLHPAGKKICQKFKVKDIVMLLISSKEREVASEALLCLQKLMLNNWQNVAHNLKNK